MTSKYDQVTTTRLLRWLERADQEDDRQMVKTLQVELAKRDLDGYDEQQAERRFGA